MKKIIIPIILSLLISCGANKTKTKDTKDLEKYYTTLDNTNKTRPISSFVNTNKIESYEEEN